MDLDEHLALRNVATARGCSAESFPPAPEARDTLPIARQRRVRQLLQFGSELEPRVRDSVAVRGDVSVHIVTNHGGTMVRLQNRRSCSERAIAGD